MPDRRKYKSSSGAGWRAELVATFLFGFSLATVLWLALWLIQLRPARAAAFREKEGALRAKEAALQNCVAAADQCGRLKDSLQAGNKQLDAKVKEALLGWGRCIHNKDVPEPQEKAKPRTP